MADQNLLKETRVYAKEDRRKSWRFVVTTMALLVASMVLAVVVDNAVARLLLSILIGLLMVRAFILFHDFYHHAILRDSPIAKGLFWTYGMLTLSPPSIWKETHNFHHAHTSVIEFSNIGSFRIMTVEEWRRSSPLSRWLYRAQRHPLTIVFGYFTVFLYGMCIQGFLRKPRKNWEGLLAVAIAVLIFAGFLLADALALYFFVWLLPSMIGAALGAYLFYAQHNFPGMELKERNDWTYTYAALHSTSFIDMPKIMHWFTGNIGYHHIHHINHRVPFYRLPEAMQGIPALQVPHVTTLNPKEVWRCLKLMLWDSQANRMITTEEIA
ncbi:fatty acid desaturase family protein [Thiosocius teredinicola]|uniref:fatty acid desaturase family protein n=1 Tax=Thiosocius teredinicola TaxID=1973002 RepID=UPI0013DD8A2E